MSMVISVHSFRRGVGKSSLVANLAALLMADGLRVGVIDTAFQSPSINVFLGLQEDKISYTFNDYLWGKCEIQQCVYDVSTSLPIKSSGKLFLVPASAKIADIMQMLHTAYDFDYYSDGISKLLETYRLDILLMDTTAGLNDQTLLSMALSNVVIVMLHADQQDYQGTAVTVEVARTLQVPRLLLVLNDAPDSLELAKAQAQLEATYHCEVGALLPHSEDMLTLASSDLLILQSPNEPITLLIKQLKSRLTA